MKCEQDGTDTEKQKLRMKQESRRTVEWKRTIQCEPFLPSSGLLGTPVRDVHVHQTFVWLPGSRDNEHSTDILRSTAFFNV